MPGEIHLQNDKRLPLRDPLGLTTAQIYLNSLQRALETANKQVILLHNINFGNLSSWPSWPYFIFSWYIVSRNVTGSIVRVPVIIKKEEIQIVV